MSGREREPGAKARAEAAMIRCKAHRGTVAGQDFLELLDARLEMNKEMLIDLSGEQMTRVQGACQELRDLRRKYTEKIPAEKQAG